MIFPKQLSYVTFEIPEAERFYELTVSGAQFGFTFEPFYSREAISAKKKTSFRGMRLDMSFSFNQTQDHDIIRQFWGDVYALPNSEIRMYLKKQDDIDIYQDFFRVVTTDFIANHTYSNTIARHGYEMSFTSILTEIGIGLDFLINEDGVFVLNNDGQKIYVDLVY